MNSTLGVVMLLIIVGMVILFLNSTRNIIIKHLNKYTEYLKEIESLDMQKDEKIKLKYNILSKQTALSLTFRYIWFIQLCFVLLSFIPVIYLFSIVGIYAVSYL